MCYKPTEAEHEATQRAREIGSHRAENGSHRAPDPRRSGTTTRPRGNPAVDQQDVDRGLERLATLLGG
jgi:hypothetical protein